MLHHMHTMNQIQPASAGQWITLNSSKQLEAPQLRISFSFGDPRIQMLSGSSTTPGSRRSSTGAGTGPNSNSTSLRPSRASSRRVSATAAPALDSSSPLEQDTEDATLELPQAGSGKAPLDGVLEKHATDVIVPDQHSVVPVEVSETVGSIPAISELGRGTEATASRNGSALAAAAKSMHSELRDATAAASSSIEVSQNSQSQAAPAVKLGLQPDLPLPQQDLTSGNVVWDDDSQQWLKEKEQQQQMQQQQQQQQRRQPEQQQQHQDPVLPDVASSSGAHLIDDSTHNPVQRQHPSEIGRPAAEPQKAAAAAVPDALPGRVVEDELGGLASGTSSHAAGTAGPSTSGFGAAVTPERPVREPTLEVTASPELSSISALVQGMQTSLPQ
jgi:hypothetical protein